MSYAFLLGQCGGCGRRFTCNPERVPSLRIEGQQHIFCLDCVSRANVQRKANGLAPIDTTDAYEPTEIHP